MMQILMQKNSSVTIQQPYSSPPKSLYPHPPIPSPCGEAHEKTLPKLSTKSVFMSLDMLLVGALFLVPKRGRAKEKQPYCWRILLFDETQEDILYMSETQQNCTTGILFCKISPSPNQKVSVLVVPCASHRQHSFPTFCQDFP